MSTETTLFYGAAQCRLEFVCKMEENIGVSRRRGKRLLGNNESANDSS